MLVVGLRRDPGAGVLFGHAALLDQPSQPHFDVGVHDDHQREQRRHSRFHQQRNVFDHNGILGHRRDDLRAALAYQRVNDPVEPLARLVVAKSLGGQRRTIQRPVGKQDVVTERVDQRRQPLGAGLDHLARDDVAVDDDPAALREGGGQRRLPGADATGQPDAQHRECGHG